MGTFRLGKAGSRQYKRDFVLPGWNVLHVIGRYNLWRTFNTARIPSKLDRISSRLTRSPFGSFCLFLGCFGLFWLVLGLPLARFDSFYVSFWLVLDLLLPGVLVVLVSLRSAFGSFWLVLGFLVRFGSFVIGQFRKSIQ